MSTAIEIIHEAAQARLTEQRALALANLAAHLRDTPHLIRALERAAIPADQLTGVRTALMQIAGQCMAAASKLPTPARDINQ